MLRGLFFALTLATGPVAAQGRPSVAVVNYPLAWMAERLGGDSVDIVFPVPEGRDPAFWRPALADIVALQEADVIALNGAGFAAWTARISLPRSRVIDTAAGFANAFIEAETVTHSHGTGGEHSHAGIASFTWLDFAQAAKQAEALAEAMARRLPDHRAEIEAALAGIISDLTALDSHATATLGNLRGTTVLSSHPRYQYLARAYGFQTSSMNWEAGAIPTETQWDLLATRATSTGATVLLWEAEPPRAAISRATELGLRSVVFSPLAMPPSEGDFLSAMQAQIDALAGS